MGDWSANTAPLVAHWEPVDQLDQEERIKRLEQEVRVQRDGLAHTLHAAVELGALVEKLSDILAEQAEEIESLKAGHHAATGLLDERTGHIVGLTWPSQESHVGSRGRAAS